MHAVMMESLEEYLAGVAGAGGSRDVEAHLSDLSNVPGRDPVACGRFRSCSASLRQDEAETWGIAPGFYAKVMEQVSRAQAGARVRRPLCPGSGVRPAAGVCVVADPGGVGRLPGDPRSRVPVGPSPEAILAQQNAPAFETASAEDNMLVTLTAYGH